MALRSQNPADALTYKILRDLMLHPHGGFASPASSLALRNVFGRMPQSAGGDGDNPVYGLEFHAPGGEPVRDDVERETVARLWDNVMWILRPGHHPLTPADGAVKGERQPSGTESCAELAHTRVARGSEVGPGASIGDGAGPESLAADELLEYLHCSAAL
jgi:hypothetical protein